MMTCLRMRLRLTCMWCSSRHRKGLCGTVRRGFRLARFRDLRVFLVRLVLRDLRVRRVRLALWVRPVLLVSAARLGLLARSARPVLSDLSVMLVPLVRKELLDLRVLRVIPALRGRRVFRALLV